MKVYPSVAATRSCSPSTGQYGEDAVGVVSVAFDDGPGGVDEGGDFEVGVLDDVESFGEAAVAGGVAVTGDHGIDVDGGPDVAQLGR